MRPIDTEWFLELIDDEAGSLECVGAMSARNRDGNGGFTEADVARTMLHCR